MPSPERSESIRAQRLRSRALWAFLVAGIGFGVTVVGLIQYAHSSEVSIRPGHEPVSGAEALESLLALLIVSSVFMVCGFFLRTRAKRHDAT